ncbi:MAG: TetR family transcriptional regulator C-terminal domain-containing protein [Alphaproteobacteria bacterium]
MARTAGHRALERWMTVSARRRGKPPEERIRARNIARILRAAVDVFGRKGFDGARIAEIASACELPKANVYYYFPTKQDIYASLIESVLAGWDRALEEIDAGREPEAAIRAYVRAKLDYSRRHAAESRFFANEMLRGGEFVTRRQRRHMRAVTADRAAIVERWVAEGRLAPIDPRHFFILLWSATQFYGDFEKLAADALDVPRLRRADFDAAAEAIAAVVLRGCLPTP